MPLVFFYLPWKQETWFSDDFRRHRKSLVTWNEWIAHMLKLVSAIFIKFLFFHQMIAPQKLWKMLFISSKKLFPFSRYSIFCISVLSFSTCRGWPKINLEVHDVINCLNNNSITHFVWCPEKENRYDTETLSIDGVSDKEHFYRKIMQKMCSKT